MSPGHQGREPSGPGAGRLLAPLARSATLESGSLQDFKSCYQVRQGGAGAAAAIAAATATAAGEPKLAKAKLERHRSSQPCQSRAQCNAFRSSKSMLLLAQNQHIPQASAQPDCFIASQQADYLNYAAALRSGQLQQLDESATWQPAKQQLAAHQHHQPRQKVSFGAEAAGALVSGGGSHGHQSAADYANAPAKTHANAGADAGASGCNAPTSSDQCNELEHEEGPSCMHIMKKLFCSLLLGTLIAVCWVMIVHTLKWIAIRGNEYELELQARQANFMASPAPERFQQAAQLLADHPQAVQVQPDQPLERLAASKAPGEPADEAQRRRRANQRAAGNRTGGAHRRQARPDQLDELNEAEGVEGGGGKPLVLAQGHPRRDNHKGQPPPPDDEGDDESAPEELAAMAGQAEPPGPQAAEPTALVGAGGALGRPGEPAPAGLVFRAPFFTSWFVSTWNILFMPVFTLISSCCFRNEDSTTKKLLVESISQFMDNGLTTLQFLGRCAFFSVLWIGTIFGIVYSLAYIDATVVMALFACSAALVYLLSWVLLHQQFVGVRIVAVLICSTGIALLAYMDNSRTLGSVLIVVGSALCSAVYKVIYQRMFGFWSIAQMSLFFTLIGVFNAFLMWPIALLLYFLGVELIVWRYIPWIHLTAAGALHLTANIVAYFGPICTYDIFLTLGLLLAVVLSAVIDVTFYKISFFGMKLAGVLLLMIGFLVCLLPENWNECLYDLVNERFVRWKKRRCLKKSRNKVQDMSTGQMSRLRTPSGRVK